MVESVLSGAIGFFAQLGIYDVVLPFLLVFTLMFAFLEKTKVLGTEVLKDSKGKEHSFSRKNLNSMVAFTIAFFVIASSQLVRIISEMLASVVILVVLGVSYMLATGVFHTGPEEYKLEGWQKTTFSIVALIGVFLILFNSLGWLTIIYDFIKSAWYNAHIASILMVLVFVGFMVWITSGSSEVKKLKKKDEKKEDDEEEE